MTRAAGARPVEQPRTRRRSHATKPPPPLRTRIRRRLPGRARGFALLGTLALLGAGVYAAAGPLFRVEAVEAAGTRFTPRAAIDAQLAGLAGQNMLALDTGELAARLEALPGVADAVIETSLPGSVQVTIQEHQPILVWQTGTALLAIAPDGGVVGEFPSAEALPEDLRALPLIDDARRSTRDVGIGERIDAVEAAAALRLATLDPALLGSEAQSISIRVDELYGFVLVTPNGWQAALGFYGREPGDGADAAAARIERQVAAVRTLFADQPEASVTWLDARNPGKIYFRATEG